jgi:hypothetical protein
MEVFYSGVVCVYKARVGGLFIGSQGWSCGESSAGGCAAQGPASRHVWPTDQVLVVNWPCCLRFFLAAIWRDIPMEDLTRLAAKWARSVKVWVNRPPYWAHLAGASAYGVHMVRCWLWWSRFHSMQGWDTKINAMHEVQRIICCMIVSNLTTLTPMIYLQNYP